ncbi:hypothetical protein LINGRAHAP2_LOCUS9942 [Linum grandiflorum]
MEQQEEEERPFRCVHKRRQEVHCPTLLLEPSHLQSLARDGRGRVRDRLHRPHSSSLRGRTHGLHSFSVKERRMP